MSCIFGENRDIFFPKLSESLHLTTFSDIAVKFLAGKGVEAYECGSEVEARDLVGSISSSGKWPCYFTHSDTTGEKDFEEFFTENEQLDMERFENLGVIKNAPGFDVDLINKFEVAIASMKDKRVWTKQDIVELFFAMIPGFGHKETGKYLDGKM